VLANFVLSTWFVDLFPVAPYPCTHDGVRGRPIIVAVCDELAFWNGEEGSVHSADEVIAALRPGMATVRHGECLIIEELNKALRDELTAINQYFLHAEMYENWGYEKLANSLKKQSIDEMKHAEALMERILFLDGSPRMKPLELTIGKTVQEMLQGDLALELGAVRDYNAAIQVCVAEKDNGSRDLFVKLLLDEEVHVDWFEAQLHLVKEVGYERYLAMQMNEDDEE
jgi:bacterioferritin